MVNQEILKKILTEDRVKKLFPDGYDIFGYEIAKEMLIKGHGLEFYIKNLTVNEEFVRLYVSECLNENPKALAKELSRPEKFIKKLLRQLK